MNSEYISTPQPAPHDKPTASSDRLAWRLGGEEPTQAALDLDAKLAADNAVEAESARSEKAQERLKERLGGTANDAGDTFPE